MKVKTLIAALEKLPKTYEVVTVLDDGVGPYSGDPDSEVYSDFVYHVAGDKESKTVFIYGVVEPPTICADCAAVARMNAEGPAQ
jgi:hypothetical protein